MLTPRARRGRSRFEGGGGVAAAPGGEGKAGLTGVGEGRHEAEAEAASRPCCWGACGGWAASAQAPTCVGKEKRGKVWVKCEKV